MTKWHTVWTSESGMVRIQQWATTPDYCVQVKMLSASENDKWWTSDHYRKLDAAIKDAEQKETRNA